MTLEIEPRKIGLRHLPWITLALVSSCGVVLALSQTDMRLLEGSFELWSRVAGAFEPRQLLTHGFFHAQALPLFCSVLLLVLLGPPLEQRWSALLFVPLLIAGATASSFSTPSLHPDDGTPMVGLAGVVAALLGASMVRFRHGFPLTAYRGGATGLQALEMPVPVLALPALWALGELAGVVGLYEAGMHATDFRGQAAGLSAGAAFAGLVEWTHLERRLFGDEPLSKPKPPNPAIEAAMTAREIGDLNQALSILTDAVKTGAHDTELVLQFWEMASFAGKPQRAALVFQGLIEKELASGERELAANHWCELVQRVRDVDAPPRLLLQVVPLLISLERERAAVTTLQLAACSPNLNPGMALRVVDLAAELDPPSALRAAHIALTSADLHETKRLRLQQQIRELTSQGVHEAERPEPERPQGLGVDATAGPLHPPVAPRTLPPEPPAPGFTLSMQGQTEASKPLCPAPAVPLLSAPPAAQVPDGPSCDPDPLELDPAPEDLPGTPGLAIHGLDLETEEYEAVATLIAEPDNAGLHPTANADPRDTISGHYAVEEDEDAAGPVEAVEALDAIVMDVAYDEPRFSEAKLIDAVPLAFDGERLTLQQPGGRRGHVEFAKVDAISVAAVQGLAEKPVVLLDLLANWTSLEGRLLRMIRLRSDQFDARSLVPDAPDGIEAFKMLTQILLEQCAAVALPDPQAAVGKPFRVYERLSTYEFEILQLDR